MASKKWVGSTCVTCRRSADDDVFSGRQSLTDRPPYPTGVQPHVYKYSGAENLVMNMYVTVLRELIKVKTCAHFAPCLISLILRVLSHFATF